jgi:Spy/CpxP family protein refolding chaperone
MRAISSALALLLSLAIVNTLRAADAAEGQESKHPPRFQNFGLPLDQLNLTDDQKAKVDELWKEYGPQIAESEKRMAAILTDEQRQARQEAGQAARASGKAPKEMRDAMESATKATDEQKAKIAELRLEMAPLQHEIREKILALLTPEQNEKLLGQAGLAHGAEEHAEPPAGSPGIQPIESLWFASTRHFPGTSDVDAALEKGLKEWQQAKVFDAALLMKYPPTFADEREFNRRANALIKEVGGQFIVSTLTVGKEGWESSANERFAKKLATAGAHYDASKAMSQTQWLETLKDVDADTWAWALEQPVRMPTPEEAARSASEFVRFAKAQHKRAVIWLSAEAFRYPSREEGVLDKMVRMEQRICEAKRADADFFVWMDLPGATLQAGESQWRETMDHLLDRILTLTPKEKAVIQWMNNPRWPTKDVEGTKLYISACQAKGINRFCLLSGFGPAPHSLDHDPFREFYRTLPKMRAAATKMGAAKAQDNNQPTSGDGEAQMQRRSAAVADVPTGRTTLEFPRGTGHRWMVNGPGRVDQRRGPGNNYWSNAPEAVLIATPEHWHAQMVLDALAAGKDVYVEKPLCHTPEEGKALVEAEKKTKQIIQVGMQRRSYDLFLEERKIVAAGTLGNVRMVRAWWLNNYLNNPQNTKLEGPLDWEQWRGPLQHRVPLDAARFRYWRLYSDYAGGIVADQGAHVFDGIHLHLFSNSINRRSMARRPLGSFANKCRGGYREVLWHPGELRIHFNRRAG